MPVRDLVPSNRQSIANRRTGGAPEPFRRWQSDIDRIFDEFWQDFDRPLAPFRDMRGNRQLVPRVDVRETDRAVEIEAELPGVKEEDIEINAADGALTISAETESERKEEKRDYVLRERSIGHFERVIPLPEGAEVDNAKADFKNGLLHIVVPKAAKGQGEGKRIAVNRG